MVVSFRKYPAPARYALALALVGAAMLMRHVLAPALGARFPFLLQFLAILAAARYIGFGPAMAALLVALMPGVPLRIVLRVFAS